MESIGCLHAESIVLFDMTEIGGGGGGSVITDVTSGFYQKWHEQAGVLGSAPSISPRGFQLWPRDP